MLHMHRSASSLPCPYSPRPTLLTFFPSQLCFNLRARKEQKLSVSCDFSCFQIKDVTYQPSGTKLTLLDQVNFSLRQKSCGLIIGRSGSGKTTLLQLIAGLNKPTSGSIHIQQYTDDGQPCKCPEPLNPRSVGIVFQFPERYFVGESVLDEITFGWPRQRGTLHASKLQKALGLVGLTGIPLDKDPNSLSGGYKRRLALAIQLVQTPDLLVLDEPLAGLDWKARADIAKLLKCLKKKLTLLIVSHDLKELAPLVDQTWRMEMGGSLKVAETFPI
ncbi:hypothetical protein DM860_016019 [Cuscuta australis]|uniref:ABC transporter domain-containing protein n=1 Tax=Cuscuta australis TaxID=267555 RepID=A0A328DIR9_9ASTE|nr:hypothetical protein DM860_016019 [Cuscuta australis]